MKLLTDHSVSDASITEEAGNVPQLRKYWNERDRKSAVRFFRYMYFLHSPWTDNPYRGYSEEIKEQKINEALYGGKFAPDETERGLLKLYEDYLMEAVPSFRAFRSARNALDRLSQYLDGVDFSERDSNGRPVFLVKDVTATIKEYPNLLAAFTTLQKSLLSDEYVVKTRGQKTINIFEEPEQ